MEKPPSVLPPILLALCALCGCSEASERSWERFAAAPVTDDTGNSYATIKLGSETWMVENLRVTGYSDGMPIAEVADETAWGQMEQAAAAFAWHHNDPAEGNRRKGALYTFAAVSSGRLCPLGWIVPDTSRWQALFQHPDFPAVQERFSDPQVSRHASGAFREGAFWWTSSQGPIHKHLADVIAPGGSVFGSEVRSGYPVRCVRAP